MVAANGVLLMDGDLARQEQYPALDLWKSSTSARENFLTAQELEAVKVRRRTLKGDAEADIVAAIEAED